MVLFGRKIKELRTKYKYTQTDLAKLIGVTKSTVAAYENDTRLPSYEVLVKLSRIFKVSLDYIVLDKQMETLCIDVLTTEQVGAIQTLIDYYRHNRITDNFPEDKSLIYEDKNTALEESPANDIQDTIDN